MMLAYLSFYCMCHTRVCQQMEEDRDKSRFMISLINVHLIALTNRIKP
jgi:hypothetical protein